MLQSQLTVARLCTLDCTRSRVCSKIAQFSSKSQPICGAFPQNRFNSRLTGQKSNAAQLNIKPCPAFPAMSQTRRTSQFLCRAARKTPSTDDDDLPERGGSGNIVGSIGIFALWAGLAAYAFLLSPNQTPLRDQYFIEKFVGLTSDPVPLNTVFFYLFYIMGIWPLIYTALLVPAAKSRNGVPAWPFFSLSYAFGAFALLPFMALWQPLEKRPKLPPAKADLEGAGNILGLGMESPVLAWLLLASGVFCVGQIATAGTTAWADYIKLVQESRLVHVTTVDFLTLTTLAPFWMDNDAQLRQWDGRDKLLPVLSFIPVIGPALYLCLRPKAE